MNKTINRPLAAEPLKPGCSDLGSRSTEKLKIEGCNLGFCPHTRMHYCNLPQQLICGRTYVSGIFLSTLHILNPTYILTIVL